MYEIPHENLPPGFAETIEEVPDEPAVPRPAATAVLMRDGDGLEILLLRRHRSSGFVPGAYVFPGGRVDDADADPALARRTIGLGADAEPAAGFWLAAIREVFEETGVLLARTDGGEPAPDAREEGMEALRESLMRDEATLLDVLDARALRPDTAGMVHIAHWITPVVEARRYDTHFFAAALPPGREARPDPREMTDAAWLRPAEALDRFRSGRLPMVFPTVRTVEVLDRYGSVAEALDALDAMTVRPTLPRLVRTERGVAIVVD